MNGSAIISGIHRRPVCVFLLQFGAPANPNEINNFLINLFEDVLFGPEWLRKRLARWLARRRLPKATIRYQQMGGGSPLKQKTEEQAQALERMLIDQGFRARVFVCMRYSNPRVAEALAEARLHWTDAHWVALPLFPQYSFATTKTSLDELEYSLTEAENTRLLSTRGYPQDPMFLEAMTECVEHGLAKFSEEERRNLHLLFSAHGIPQRFVRQGDPYMDHLRSTVDGIIIRLNEPYPYHLAFQSRVGPMAWIGPSSESIVQRLGEHGIQSLLVIPVSFVSENLETLVDLDIELAQVAKQAGIQHFVRAPTLGNGDLFIQTLFHQVVRLLPFDEPRSIETERTEYEDSYF